MGYVTVNHSLFRQIFLESQIVISRLLGEQWFWARETSCLMHPSPCGAIPADAVFMEQGSLFLWTMLEVLCHLLLHISFRLALSVDLSVPSALSPLNWPGLHLPVSGQLLLFWSTVSYWYSKNCFISTLRGRLFSIALISCLTHNKFFLLRYLYVGITVYTAF